MPTSSCGGTACRSRPLQDLAQHAGRDLAAAAAAVRERGELDLQIGGGIHRETLRRCTARLWRSWRTRSRTAARSTLGLNSHARARQAEPSRRRNARSVDARCISSTASRTCRPETHRDSGFRPCRLAIRVGHEHRRAAADRFQDRLRAAFHLRRVQEQRRVAHQLARPRARQLAEPAITRRARFGAARGGRMRSSSAAPACSSARAMPRAVPARRAWPSAGLSRRAGDRPRRYRRSDGAHPALQRRRRLEDDGRNLHCHHGSCGQFLYQ